MDSTTASTATSTAAETTGQIEKEWNALLFNARRSVRYHSKRAGFLGFNAKLFIALSIFTGMGVFTSFLAGHEILFKSIGALLSLLAILNLVFRIPEKEQQHLDLKKRFIMLEKSMVTAKSIDKKTLDEKNNEYYMIEVDEAMDIIENLNKVCYNEQAIAQGNAERLEISWLGKLFCQISAK